MISPGRRRLRHQLRRPPAPRPTSTGTTSSPGSGRSSTSSSATSRPASARSGTYLFDKPKLKRLMEQGSAYVVDQGWGTRARPRVHRGRRPARRGRPRPRQRPGLSPAATTSAARSARATTSSKSRSSTASSTSAAASVMGLREGQITVLIHSGSRGLGYQVCDDYLGVFKGAPKQYGFSLPDPQLACAPVRSPEGQSYLGAMRAAANYAWCNRQLLTHQAREVFARVFGKPWEDLGHGPGLRRRPQHRQVRGPRRRRRLLRSRSASTARGRPGPSRPAIPRSPRPTRRSASR